MKNNTVPVIVLNWNGMEDTLECMAALSAQTYQNMEIFLVDNGSGADNVNQLHQHFGHRKDIQLIFNSENQGFTKGNNQVLDAVIAPDSPYKYVALLNNDTWAAPEWLEKLVWCAEQTGSGMVSSKMINYYNRTVMDNAGHLMLNTAEIIPLGHGQPIEKFETRMENMGSCAGATLYSVAMLRDIGLFDEYFDTGYEDAELGLRAILTGYKSTFEPQAVVFHKVSRSVGKIMNFDYLVKIQLNIFYSYFKLMPLPALLLSLPFLIFKYGAVLLIDVLFLRIRFLRLMSRAIFLTMFREWSKIRSARKHFYSSHKTIAWHSILRRQKFFLWFDMMRFVKHVLFKKPVIFERY
jgi:hypothetical protein